MSRPCVKTWASERFRCGLANMPLGRTTKWGADMPNQNFFKQFLRVLVTGLVAGVLMAEQTASAQQASPAATDPNLWLEDVDGQRAMDWVRAENARSLPVLENDRRFPALLQSA